MAIVLLAPTLILSAHLYRGTEGHPLCCLLSEHPGVPAPLIASFFPHYCDVDKKQVLPLNPAFFLLRGPVALQPCLKESWKWQTSVSIWTWFFGCTKCSSHGVIMKSTKISKKSLGSLAKAFHRVRSSLENTVGAMPSGPLVGTLGRWRKQQIVVLILGRHTDGCAFPRNNQEATTSKTTGRTCTGLRYPSLTSVCMWC